MINGLHNRLLPLLQSLLQAFN